MAGVPERALTWTELAAAAADPARLPEGMEPGLKAEADFAGSGSYPFGAHCAVAAVLGKSPSQVRVYAMPVGGGFGGKFGLIEPLVAACAVAAGRPVRLAFTRNEDFSAACPAPSSLFRVKAAARKDGTLRLEHVLEWEEMQYFSTVYESFLRDLPRVDVDIKWNI